MYVTRRHNRLFVAFSEHYDLPVQILQILDRLAVLIVLPRHKHIIADRLDLQIIIEIDQSCDLRLWCIAQQCPVKLTCLTRRSENQPLAVLLQQTLRYTRPPVVILQM